MIGNAANRFGYADEQIDELMRGTVFAQINENDDPDPDFELDVIGQRGLSDGSVPESSVATLQ